MQRRDAPKPQDFPTGQLIDLTSSAQKATERIRLGSSPPPSPYMARNQRAIGHVDQHEVNPPPRRQIIELNDQMPPSTAYTSERSYVIRQQPSHAHLPSGSQGAIYAPGSSQHIPTERYITHERPVDPRVVERPLQYLPQRAHVPVEERYYVIDDDRTRHAPIQYVNQPIQLPSRYIVLDHPQTMDGLERSYDTRQQAAYR